MKVYAYVQNATVVEVIPPSTDESGSEIHIDLRFHPDFVKDLVVITDLDPRPTPGWTYDGASFSPPSYE